MRDNATPHTARVVTAQLANLDIQVLPWPAKTTDLNPIEHQWDEIERRLRVRPVPTGNLNELKNALTQEWNAIPQARFVRLINSRRNRSLVVANSKRGNTRY